MRYYLRTESGEHGPFTQDELVQLIEEQDIREAAVRTDVGPWKDVREFRAFRESMPTERPPPRKATFETVAVARHTASRLFR